MTADPFRLTVAESRLCAAADVYERVHGTQPDQIEDDATRDLLDAVRDVRTERMGMRA